MSDRPRVLVVEDDARLAELVAGFFERNGLSATVERDGTAAVARILAELPDAVVLDVGLPGEDGLSVCRRVRERFTGPILMYSASGDEVDQVVGLELGADDYVPKPASPRLLLARLRALLRRATPAVDAPIALGALVVDGRRREAWLDGRLLDLTTAEYDLLHALAVHPGRPMSRQELMRACRGIDYDGVDRSLDARVVKLRQRLGDLEPPHRWIKTVRGVGYLLAAGEP